jgi:hypothetical protein
MTFDELAEICARKGEAVRSVVRINPVKWQANLVSKHDWNASGCDTGKTATEALRNVMVQRGHLSAETPDIDDLI